MLSKHRGGLNAIARALLDNEIIDGAEVARLVDEAHGSPVHDEGAKSVPHFHEAAISTPVVNGANGNASGNGDAVHAETESALGTSTSAVAVPTAPTPPAHQADPETWAPPPWPPPANPSAGAPEGPATR